jgi:CHAD domain-containing protein
MYRRVRKEGKSINHDSHPEALHDLRKSCKKLRYLMEFFQSLYPKHEIKGLIKTLKVLLDNLGNFQDLAVQAEKLRDMAHTMADNKQANVDTLLAMGTLVGGLLERQHQARLEFARIFEHFDAEANREAYQTLFRHPQEKAS